MNNLKIVSLLPSTTELICALGLEDNILAVSHECDYPASVRNKEHITSSIIPHGLSQKEIDDLVSATLREGKSLYSVFGERLAELQPDLVLTQGLCDVCAVTPDTVETSLRGVRCTLPNSCEVLSMNGTSLEGICTDLRLLGEHTSRQDNAQTLITEANDRWCAISDVVEPARVLLLEWIDPFFSAGHWVPEQASAAGCVSVIGTASEDSRRLTVDEIIDANPSHIAVVCCGYGLEQNIKFAQRLYSMEALKDISALQTEQVWAFDANSYFSRPTLRIVRGAELLYEAIHNGCGRSEESMRVLRTT